MDALADWLMDRPLTTITTLAITYAAFAWWLLRDIWGSTDMPEYDIDRDQWGNPVERDRWESKYGDGPGTPGYAFVGGYPVDKTVSMSEAKEEKQREFS